MSINEQILSMSGISGECHLQEINNLIKRQENNAKKIRQNCYDLYNILNKTNITLFHKSSKYIWKRVFTGYTDRLALFKKTGRFFPNKKMIIYDLDDIECFMKAIRDRNYNDLFEAIEEVNNWIFGYIDLIREDLNNFDNKNRELELDISVAINSYKLLTNSNYS